MGPMDHSPRTHSVRLAADGLAIEGSTPALQLLGFIDTMLRGIAQVMLQGNSYTGALFVTGIFFNSALLGLGVLAGTAVSTATAMLLGVERASVRAGLYGFNGALVAIALLYFLEPTPLAWGYVVLAAASTTVLMAALQRLLATWQLPALTAPFVLTTLLFVLATARFGHLHATHVLPTAGLPVQATVEGVVTFATLWQGVLAGIAQVFFQSSLLTGAFFVAGLAVASRRACIVAVLGSLAGALVAWGMGAAEPGIRAGAFGFNPVLTAIALQGGAWALNATSTACTGLAVVVTAIVFAALSAALAPIGMPALTAPFVLVTWLFLLAGPLFGRLRRDS